MADLEAIGDFIARDDAGAAQGLVTRIAASVEQLGDYPHLGRAGRISGTRELVVPNTPYVVPYRVRSDEVEVLAVFHGARRWPDAFG